MARTRNARRVHVLGSRVIAQHSGVRLCERLRARSPQCGGYRSGQVAVRASPARYGSARVYGCAVCTLGRREYPPDRSRVTLGSRPGTVVRGGRGRGCGPVCRQQPRHGPCPRGEAQVRSRTARPVVAARAASINALPDAASGAVRACAHCSDPPAPHRRGAAAGRCGALAPCGPASARRGLPNRIGWTRGASGMRFLDF